MCIDTHTRYRRYVVKGVREGWIVHDQDPWRSYDGIMTVTQLFVRCSFELKSVSLSNWNFLRVRIFFGILDVMDFRFDACSLEIVGKKRQNLTLTIATVKIIFQFLCVSVCDYRYKEILHTLYMYMLCV